MAIGPETATLGGDLAEREALLPGLVRRVSPPLTADTEEFELMHDALHAVFTQAWERIAR
jgi:hypothetical protein